MMTSAPAATMAQPRLVGMPAAFAEAEGGAADGSIVMQASGHAGRTGRRLACRSRPEAPLRSLAAVFAASLLAASHSLHHCFMRCIIKDSIKPRAITGCPILDGHTTWTL